MESLKGEFCFAWRLESDLEKDEEDSLSLAEQLDTKSKVRNPKALLLTRLQENFIL
jgi:hypothetical protein